MVNGAERWASDDGALVEYRMGTGRLDFHAWRHTEYYEYWSLGGEISIIETPANFQAAAIEAHYYMSVNAPCEVVQVQYDSHRNDNYFDQYTWGIHMSDYDRPAANGSIVNGSTIKMTFPDDATYTGTLQPPNRIVWSNGSAWTKV
jgi:hypothetical protein